MAKKITEEMKSQVEEAVKAEFAASTQEDIKTAIADAEAKAKENVKLNNESIKFYRARAAEARELREKARCLRSLLKVEKSEKTVEAAIGFMSEDQLKDLIAKAQEKLQK